MNPRDAGFDGVRGIRIQHNGDTRLHLRRGHIWPDTEKLDFKNQLLWYEPLGLEPRLLYCNNENQLFELTFTPVSQNE